MLAHMTVGSGPENYLVCVILYSAEYLVEDCCSRKDSSEVHSFPAFCLCYIIKVIEDFIK